MNKLKRYFLKKYFYSLDNKLIYEEINKCKVYGEYGIGMSSTNFFIENQYNKLLRSVDSSEEWVKYFS